MSKANKNILNSSSNGWDSWGKHVLVELQRLNERSEKIEGRLTIIEKDIVALKIKSGLWGALAGCIPATLILILKVVGVL